MDLQKTALIAEILGGVGIICSIIYLGFEVSQSTKNTEMANHLALTDQNGELSMLQISDPNLHNIIQMGSVDIESLSKLDRSRFELYGEHAFNLWETSYFMAERDLLPADTWQLWNFGWCDWLKSPGFRDLWAAGLNRKFTVGFQNNVRTCHEQ